MNVSPSSLASYSIVILIVGFLSLSFYYNYFDVNISYYLDTSEIILLSLPKFDILIRSFLISITFNLPFILISWLITLRKRNSKQSELYQVSYQPERFNPDTKSIKKLLIFLIFLLAYPFFNLVIHLLRAFTIIILGSPEFYFFPGYTLLFDILPNMMYLMFTIGVGQIIYLLTYKRIAFSRYVSLQSFPKVVLNATIILFFLITFYYKYADACRIIDAKPADDFELTFNENSHEKISSMAGAKLIGFTRNYYFVLSKNQTVIIKSSDVKELHLTHRNYVFDYKSVDLWDVPWYFIFPQSLNTKH